MGKFKWEYFLRQYIDISVRYNLSEGTLMILQNYYNKGRGQWEQFETDFRKKKSTLNKRARYSFYEDMVHDFYPMIEMYFAWYEKNKDEIKRIVNTNIDPYSELVHFCRYTKAEIEVLNKQPVGIKPIADNSKNNALKAYLSVLTDLISELVPEPFEVNRIESRIAQIDKLKYEFADIRLKLWDNMEAVLMSDLAENIRMEFLQRFYSKFEYQHSIFNAVYNRQSLNRYPPDGTLYASSQGLENANAVYGMLENDRNILYVFNEDYKLPFPAPQIDLERHVITNLASPEYKQLFEKLVKLKPEWDRLKDYKSKLKFWIKNTLSIDEWSYFLSGDSETKNLPENCITIYPFKKEEIPVWKHFYYDNFNKYNFNTLATSKQKYSRHIEKGADPIPFTNNVIRQIDDEYAKNDKIKQHDFRYYCIGYNTSQNGRVDDFLNNPYLPIHLFSMREFCTGVVHEQYRRFLVSRLEKPKGTSVPTNESAEHHKVNKIVLLTWGLKYNFAKTLYRKLKDESCIPQETDIKTFTYIFSGKPGNTLKKPIQWLKSNRLLAYLLYSLKEKKLIDKDWQSKAGKGNFFITSKNKPVTANDLAKAVSDCVGFEERPKGTEIIDRILQV